MEWSYDFWDNVIVTPKNVKIRVPVTFVDYMAVNGIWIGVMDGFPRNVNNENVVAFTESGELLWHIEKLPETSGSRADCYKTIDKNYKVDNLVKIVQWNHYEALVDITTGKVKKLVDTMPGWKAKDNLLLGPNNIQVKMPYAIINYGLVLDKVLVLVGPPQETRIAENAFLVDPSGAIIWQVEGIPETTGEPERAYNYYELLEDKKTLKLTSPIGFINHVDLATGKNIKTEFSKWT